MADKMVFYKMVDRMVFYNNKVEMDEMLIRLILLKSRQKMVHQNHLSLHHTDKMDTLSSSSRSILCKIRRESWDVAYYFISSCAIRSTKVASVRTITPVPPFGPKSYALNASEVPAISK